MDRVKKALVDRLILACIIFSLVLWSNIVQAEYLPTIPPPPFILRETPITVVFVEPKRFISINVTQFDPEQVVKKVNISFIKPVPFIHIQIFHLSERPPEVPTPKEVPLLFFTIRAHKDLLENIDLVIITFAIKKDVVRKSGVIVDTIVLQRFFEGKWERVLTVKVGENKDFLFFTSVSPGLSHFVVVGLVPPPYFWWMLWLAIAIIVLTSIIAYLLARRYVKVKS